MSRDAVTARKQSVAIMSTHSAAAAFGEDIADDAYSVSELSHVEEDQRIRRVKGQSALTHSHDNREAFLRTAVRHGPGSLGRLSYTKESQRTSSSSPPRAASGQNGEDGNNDAHSDASRERSTEGSGNDVKEADEDEDVGQPTESAFAQFARSGFRYKGTTHTYCCAALPHPLLLSQDRADFLASLAAWVLILRIMGDLPDRDTNETLQVAGDQPPVISMVRNSYRHKYSRKDVEDAQCKYSELFKDPQGAAMQGVPFLPDVCDSMLDKVQYLTALGIYRPQLRDELYCQLCKQLTNNPSRNSCMRGWVLMTLFAASFAPSEKFAECLASFVLEGPSEVSLKVDRLLRRTCAVSTRAQPPSWLEFQACKNNKPLLVPVTLMNGFRTLCEVDSASTVQEVLHNLAVKMGLDDLTGYSIFVTLHTKISCLGHGMHRVMDAISECEQHTKQMGMRESNSLWRLFFRREYFTPWDAIVLQTDHVNTDLIYQQVMRGISVGEYKCEKEDVMVLLAAQQYYIEHSGDSLFEKLDHFVRHWLTEDMLSAREPMYYVDKVRKVLQTSLMVDKPEEQSLKHDIAVFAMDKWFLPFSRFYDAPKVVGPGVSLSRVTAALNNKGVYIMDDTDTIRLHIAFWEVASVTKGRQLVTVRTLKGDDYVMTINHSDDFIALLTSFIRGLRMRSRFAVVTEDTIQSGSGKSSTVLCGDLLTMNQPYSQTIQDSLLNGACSRTGGTCEVPREKLYFLATTEQPTGEMLGRVVMQLRKDPMSLLNEVDHKSPNLQLYSRHNFRPVTESTVTKFLNKASFKRDKVTSLWRFSRDSLKKPLLKRTCNREELKRLACRAFSAIQQFMGDLAVKQEISDIELVNDCIIDPARRNKYLRDEIYCQIMKQLTNNPDKHSEERGWLLLTLLCVTTCPHGELLDQYEGFLRAAKHPQARVCSGLLAAHKANGSRLYPPHALEHDMVTRQQPNVRAHVLLPSGTTVTVEVGSRSRISDIKREVQRRLQLISVAEYSLFLSGGDSMHSLPDRGFYFDCLTQAENYRLTHRANSSDLTCTGAGMTPAVPTLVMLKKIWVNVTPGEDLQADKHFHFPQEVPNYVRGYHQLRDEEVVPLAALLYRALYGQDTTGFAKFGEIAPSILPRGYSKNTSLEDVKKDVQADYNSQHRLNQDEARQSFLRKAVAWPTYGSVFFEVKQRAVRSVSKYCLLAVNTSGVHLSDLQTKEVIRTYQFKDIPNWAFDRHSFTLVILKDGTPSRLLLETNVGHNMDDVLMAHIGWVMDTEMKKKHGFYNNVGESIC
ncbi:unconventional myosin-VIIa-like isoform X2 [Babylonia areolata]|uniref:unconventional myosin-VIIa-like isoform X2 n=1 Tax=Babylonia areolata TaxID=304850 RepID=UPI003FD68AF6